MKSTPEQRAELSTLHNAAGVRYAAAVQELQDAYVELLGVGVAASNTLIGAIHAEDRLVASVPLAAPVHPKYLPQSINPNVLNRRANDRAAELCASVGL